MPSRAPLKPKIAGSLTLRLVSFQGGRPLPKTLTKNVWLTNGPIAFEYLEKAGKILTDNLGFALDRTSGYIPYDSLFAPLAVVLKRIGYDSLSPTNKAKALRKIERWAVGAVLSTRYQEGVHNKQKGDAEFLANFIIQDSSPPAWLEDVRVPQLKRLDPNGAIGRLLMCLLNTRNLKDPLSNTPTRLGQENCEDHHIFPRKFCDKLPDWDKSVHVSDTALNLMRVSSSTNARFLNDDPRLQVLDSFDKVGEEAARKIYEEQLIPPNAIAILLKQDKTAADYRDFLAIREGAFREHIKTYFGFVEGADLSPDQGDEEEASPEQ